MNLYFTGHQEKYAVEQTMLTLFPQERPVYPDPAVTPPGGDNALELQFTRRRPSCGGRGRSTPACAGCGPQRFRRTTRWWPPA